MITRIVKLTINPAQKEDFIAVFKTNKHHILAQKGNLDVELLQDKKYPNLFFTYSHWESESDLNLYRKTEVFNKIWKETKSKFCSQPEAWSTYKIG